MCRMYRVCQVYRMFYQETVSRIIRATQESGR